jgi:hypothetical protein
MSDNPKIVEFPKAEVSTEEHARRLKLEVDRLASLPHVEWLYYVECTDIAEKYDLSRPVLRKMVEAAINAQEKSGRKQGGRPPQ